MFNILSSEPWFEPPELPEPGIWWDGLMKALREIVRPILGFALPGLVGGFLYAMLYDKPVVTWTLGLGLLSLVVFFCVAYVLETCRQALQQLNIRGHVKCRSSKRQTS